MYLESCEISLVELLVKIFHSHKKRKDSLETRAVVQNFNNKLEFLRAARVLANRWRTRNTCIWMTLISSSQIFWNMVMNFNKILIWQLKKYLQSITHHPIHVLFASKFAFQKMDSPDYQH